MPIAGFASDVTNFVIGMINSLTSGNVALASFTAPRWDRWGPRSARPRQQIISLGARRARDQKTTPPAGVVGACRGVRSGPSAIEAQIVVLKARRPRTTWSRRTP